MSADKDKFKEIVKCSSKLKKAIDMDMQDIAKLKTDKTKLAKQKRDASSRCKDMLDKEAEVKAKLEVEEMTFKVKLEALNKQFSKEELDHGSKMLKLDKELDSKNKELEQVNKMIEKAEKDYIKADKKVSVAKNNVLEEEDRIETVKENFKEWKISAVEELARMKLRGKMKNIDEAGLKDVLSR